MCGHDADKSIDIVRSSNDEDYICFAHGPLVLQKTRSNACWTRLTPDSELRHHLEGEASRHSVPGNQPKSIAADSTTVVINSSPSTNCISRMQSACPDDIYSINTYILPCTACQYQVPSYSNYYVMLQVL